MFEDDVSPEGGNTRSGTGNAAGHARKVSRKKLSIDALSLVKRLGRCIKRRKTSDLDNRYACSTFSEEEIGHEPPLRVQYEPLHSGGTQQEEEIPAANAGAG